MNIEQEIRAQIEKNKGLKLAVGEINNHLSILEGLLRNERDDVQKQVNDAYQRGLEEGKKATWGLVADASSAEYQRGLDDAWEAAKKIALMDTETSENVTGYFGLFRIMENLTPMQAIEKLKAYEEQKADDEIKVGDEVRHKSAATNESCGIVTKDWKNSYFIMWNDGSSGQWYKDRVVKTGRHFDIDKILEEMRHD